MKRAPKTGGRTGELERALGVTRVARITGLDRAGVEVACAVRPMGHVLQVCNGKGETFERARASALGEAAELWAAERIDPSELVFGSLEELRARRGEDAVWDAADLGSAGPLLAPELWSARTFCAFRRGVELFSGEEVWVPAQAVHCPPSGSPLIGPIAVGWSSNGMGAHPDRDQALLHALLEAVERDQLGHALSGGWTARELARRMIDPASLPKWAPRAASWRERVGAGGFEVYLFDLALGPGRDLGLPVAAALLVDRDEGPIPVTAGYACALRRDDALLSALFEAAQSRLTDVHGAREDVAAMEPSAASTLRRACARVRPTRSAEELPELRSRTAEGAVAGVLECLRRAGRDRVAAVELAPSWLGLSVVKVVVPGLRISELL